VSYVSSVRLAIQLTFNFLYGRFQIQVSSADGKVIAGNNGVVYRNVIHALVDIYKTTGFHGLLRGAGTRILFHTPSTAITMAVYEECKKLWSQVV
jgi:hypothetical protein